MKDIFAYVVIFIGIGIIIWGITYIVDYSNNGKLNNLATGFFMVGIGMIIGGFGNEVRINWKREGLFFVGVGGFLLFFAVIFYAWGITHP
jgi:uncharacterized membrane protein HdeD (DUF308 family)